MKPAITIERTIRAAAILKGFADASVARQYVRSEGSIDFGEWWVLSVWREDAEEFEVLGRRRTKAELLTMIEGAKAQICASNSHGSASANLRSGSR
jgi:hypothetical protein